MKKVKTLREFDYSEFVRFVRDTPRSEHARIIGLDASEKGSTKFTQTDSIEDTYKIALNGWQTGIDELATESHSLSGKGFNVHYANKGKRVNIARYINDKPKQFFAFAEKDTFDLKPLRVYVQLTYLGNNSGTKALKFAKEITNLINALKSKYDIELIGLFDTSLKEGIDNTFITIKKHGENIVLNTIAAAFHPSFFRRLYFKYIETLDYGQSGYGSNPDAKAVERSVKKNARGRYSILLPRLDSLSSSAKITADSVKAIKEEATAIDAELIKIKNLIA